MHYLRLFTGADGHSQFEHVTLPSAPAGRGNSAEAEPIALGGMIVSRYATGFVEEQRAAPRRQFVVTLAGAGEVVNSRGDCHKLDVGSVLLVEDTTGRGHLTRTVGTDPWRVLWLPLAGEPSLPAGAGDAGPESEPLANYARIASTADGGSTFEDVAIPPRTGGGLQVSAPLPVASLVFRESPTVYDITWHTAPRRQLIVTLRGAVEIEVSSGERRQFAPGSLLSAEDLTGKGHCSRNAGTEKRLSLFIPFAT